MPRAAYKFVEEVQEVINNLLDYSIKDLSDVCASEKEYTKAVRRLAYELLDSVKSPVIDTTGPDVEHTLPDENN